LPDGQLPHDHRLEPLKDLDGYFPFTPSASRGDWEKRAEALRRQIQVSLGLWPMPERTPLNAVVHGRIERDDYAVEKVFFESRPGFFVTGSLYRPKNAGAHCPAVLCPHGHWPDGRFYDNSARIKQELADGAERFAEGGSSPLQARCVQLARMGCVVFHYDMIGYADSQQIPMEIAHGFNHQRSSMNAEENWGLFSPQAEAHLQSVMGLQTWNSIRALDFVCSLPDVDTNRVGVTGASGGGTQTFILGALDSRPSVIFPAVMVSTAMQGGCTCENASLLRVDTGNVEIAALFAPKPLGMTAADDWTKEMPAKGFPELKKHFEMMGAPQNVMLKPLVHFGHNYNHVSRTAMYGWMNRQFKLGLAEPVLERDYKRLTREEMTVWDAAHPAPLAGEEFERRLLRDLTKDSNRQLAGMSPDQQTAVVRAALDVILGRNLENAGVVEWNMATKNDRGAYLEMAGLLVNKTHREELPVLFLFPKSWKERTVVWLAQDGKGGLFDSSGGIKPAVQSLLDSGATVLGVDLLYQGEFLGEGKLERTPKVANPREAAAYTFGYNRSVFAQRVADVLTVIKYVEGHERKSRNIDLVALDSVVGPIAIAARAQAGAVVNHMAAETGGFRFGRGNDLRSPNFLPGGAKYGDLPGMLSVASPAKAWLRGEKRDALGKVENVVSEGGDDKSAVSWLLQP
jgi:dienelactone hydrolase